MEGVHAWISLAALNLTAVSHSPYLPSLSYCTVMAMDEENKVPQGNVILWAQPYYKCLIIINNKGSEPSHKNQIKPNPKLSEV